MEFQQPSCYHEATLGVEFMSLRWESRKIEGGWLPDDHEAAMLPWDSQPLDFMLHDRKRNFYLLQLLIQLSVSSSKSNFNTYIQFLPLPQVFLRAPRKIQSLTEAVIRQQTFT